MLAWCVRNKVVVYTILKAILNIYHACTKDSLPQRDMADVVRAILLGQNAAKDVLLLKPFLVQANIQSRKWKDKPFFLLIQTEN